MARIHYSDDYPSAPVGYEMFHPGEEREVSDAQAAELTRNVHFTLVPDPPPPPPPAPAPAPTPDPTPPAEPAQPAQGGS